MSRARIAIGVVCVSVLVPPSPLAAQRGGMAADGDTTLYHALQWRMVGPYRGGRSSAVTGLAETPHTFFMGTTGGGVWKTTDAGHTWSNVSDGYFGGSIGAIDVADADPNVIIVGTGSMDIRGNTSTGRGIYKSTDGGTTWRFAGLREAGQIGRVEIHPGNPDLVYVAALGHPFGTNAERGVFRSRDGGQTWENVLFFNDSTGASDLTMNPRNPRVLYAGAWRGQRTPWTMLSGGPDGGVYKTTDGGDAWEKLAGGLPTGIVGKVGVSVSPANPNRVWAIIEAEPDGGVYRSDDAGKTWTRVNSENKLRQRAFYYTHVQADPGDEHTVYALNTRLFRSVDGGKTFEQIDVPHGDIHDLWINPQHPDIMIVADDGGGQVSLNGGATWSTYYNQPTAELYDVIVDNAFPYRVYGAQQDNTTISLPAWSSSNTLYPKQHWENVGGCETGPIGVHPDHPDVVWAGCYSGALDRFDLARGQRRNLMLYPQVQVGEAGRNLRYRFQWVSPIVVSPHDRNVVYHASQYVHRTTDGGSTWQTISPDLTTNTPAHQDYAGGPLNHDITGVEIYNTIFALAVSPHAPDVVWAGSDDGRVHVTRDGGTTWDDVTPRGMPRLGTVDEIEISAHRPGRVFLAVQRYRLDDFAPYVFRTDDGGRSWRLLTDGRNGIPADAPVRTVREDPERQGLLYAGTEFGVFVSLDDGRTWRSLQLNLPITPVTGMRVAHDDLIVSTQGRSFWILDDVTPLRQITDAMARAAVHLYRPRDAYRVNAGGSDEEYAPAPRPGPALLHYQLGAAPATPIALEIRDAAGRVLRRFSSDSATAKDERLGDPISATAGMNRAAWDLTARGPHVPDSVVAWGYTGGITVPPGTYQVHLMVGDETRTQPLEVRPDPRLEGVAPADFAAQFALAVEIRDTLDALYAALQAIRSVRDQVTSVARRASDAGFDEGIGPAADSVAAKLTAIEEELTQTRNVSNQDPLRFPPKLDSQYIGVYEYVTGPDNYRFGGAEGRPTAGAYQRSEDLTPAWNGLRDRLQAVLETDVPAFNAMLRQVNVPGVIVPGGGS